MNTWRNASWRTSTHSGGQETCVEVAPRPGLVGVRDSKHRDAGYLTVPATAWRTFTHALITHS